MDFSILTTWDGLIYLVILSLLEIVLGIDNIIFISIVTDKLKAEQKRKARNIGLTLALVVRLVLLSVVAWIMSMTKPLFEIMGQEFSGQSIVLLLVKGHEEVHAPKGGGMSAVIGQIVMIDIVFSFDSIISAIGMTNGVAKETGGDPMVIIYAAVIISMLVMLAFAKQISDFINDRPTIKMIALGFLVTIGVILVAEAFHQHIPKGYIYFAMVYALAVELLNIRMRKNKGLE